MYTYPSLATVPTVVKKGLPIMRLRSKCKKLEELGPSQPGQTPLSSLKPGERGVVVGLSGSRGLMCEVLTEQQTRQSEIVNWMAEQA